MRMHNGNEQLDPSCIYEFIECERNLSCKLCELASSRSGMTRFVTYISQIIRDKGLEEALDYYYKLNYVFGIGTATAIKEKIGNEPISSEAIKNVLIGNYTSFGMDYEIKTNSKSIEVTIHNCPLYQTLRMQGFENSVIIQFCDHGKKGEHSAVTKVFPDLKPFSVHRQKGNGVCKEGYYIEDMLT